MPHAYVGKVPQKLESCRKICQLLARSSDECPNPVVAGTTIHLVHPAE